MYPQVNCARHLYWHSLQAGTGGKGEVVKTKKRPNVVVVVVRHKGTSSGRPAVGTPGRGEGEGEGDAVTCNLQEVLDSEKRTVKFTIVHSSRREKATPNCQKRLVRSKAFTKRRGQTAKKRQSEEAPKEERRFGKVWHTVWHLVTTDKSELDRACEITRIERRRRKKTKK